MAHPTRNGGSRHSGTLALTSRNIHIIWRILAPEKPYHEPGVHHSIHRLDPKREIRYLIARLEALGHHVTLEDTAA